MEPEESSLCVREVELELEEGRRLSLSVAQSWVGQVGEVVWDGALVAAHYLARRRRDEPGAFPPATVLELGAGTGLCSILVAKMGARVTATDLPEVLPLLRHNISRNSASVTAEALVWGEGGSKPVAQPALLLLVDCLYYEESLAPLLRTLDRLTGPETEILCVYEERDVGKPQVVQNKFLEMARLLFRIDKVPLEEQDESFSSPDIHVLKLTRL